MQSTYVPGTTTLADGVYDFFAKATDANNNSSALSSPLLVTIDHTAPVVTAPANQSFAATSSSGAVVNFVTGSATDAGGSGLSSLTYGPANGSVFPVGVTTVTMTATDVAGNVATKTFTITVTPLVGGPTGTIKIDGGAPYTKSTTATITLNFTDPGGALKTMSFSTNGVNYLPAVQYGASYSLTLPSGDGTKTVSVKVVDTAGNSTIATATILLDQTPPTITITQPASGSSLNVNQTTSLIYTVTDWVAGSTRA